ncbi:helix-turn-helix domain-containing protein [Bacillus niameyensis]|uniref:helix-turn-helix domain-containing protein n=1 Tax=Bacillus niameyensis TaxID=1522308 RepID=UPI000781A616|nr:helix-turn-helix transcriptional regulator [Bacillus niameyensis]
MTLNIGAKILELRKARNITQERLAEAIGVSIAAVSKWECAATYPDIALLPAIASYFEVSIDTLMDYQVQPNNLQEYRDTLQKFVQVSDYQSGLPIAEKVLKQYPNDFHLLMSIGTLKLSEGTSEDCADKKSTVEKAIDYFQRSLAVKPADSPTKKESIQQIIAFAYSSIKEYDQAISILEEMNVNGVFDPDIAFNLIEAGKINEAMEKLQHYLFSMAFGFAMVTESLGKCFREKGKLQYVVDLQLLHASFLANFTHNTPNYFDSLCSMSYHDLAKFQREAGDLDGMWRSIEKSVYHAVRFDQNPSYTLASVKFMDDCERWVTNNSSENACRGALERIKSDFSEFQADARYVKFINELESAAKDKRESGIWQ